MCNSVPEAYREISHHNMLVAPTLVTTVIIFWLVSCVALKFLARKTDHVYPSISLFVGGTALVAAAGVGWRGEHLWNVLPHTLLPRGLFLNHIDTLSSIFAGLLGIVTMCVALFSPGYFQGNEKAPNLTAYWMHIFLFASGLLGVMLAADAIGFLVWWEVMALSSLRLVFGDAAISNVSANESRTTSFAYLGATRAAAAFLLAGFIWMHVLSRSWNFAQWDFSSHKTLVPAVLILAGFSISGGLWPFHRWIATAISRAPSPVSALISGVMIETALYGVIRILILHGLISPYVAYVFLGLGVLTALRGVFLARGQQNLSSLLAYSTIQNVGLIVTGIAATIIGRKWNLPIVMAFGLSGAIYHCLNHGVFKSLLLLGAGAVDRQVRSSDLEIYGGLGKKMPWTMICFVVGAAAICGLPVLGGFNSQWLIFQSFFQMPNSANSPWLCALSVVCIGALGLSSGLSVSCLTKAIGSTFLGSSRSAEAKKANEVDIYMIVAQVVLAICCVASGVLAPAAIALIKPVCLAARAGGIPEFPIPIALYGFGVMAITVYVYAGWLRPDEDSTVISTTFQNTPTEDQASQLQSVSRPGREGPMVQIFEWLGEHMFLLQSASPRRYSMYTLVTVVAIVLLGVLT